jgi:hypothetical protein
MDAVFFETSPFSALRPCYLDEEAYRLLQEAMLENPVAGDLMPRTGGFRKLRWPDQRRGKGKGKRGPADHLLPADQRQAILDVFRLRQG